MTINIFKKTILLHIFIFLSMILVAIIEETFFPYEEVESDTSIAFVILLFFIIVLLPFMWYCLYKLKPIGKRLFILYLILGLIIFFVAPDDSYIITTVTPVTPFFEFSESVYALLDGVVLAFLFFTDVKEKFK
jgi:hypothetical protein